MTDPNTDQSPDTSTTDTPADLVKTPEQPPMDDASGQDEQMPIDDTDTDDLSVQGGE